MIRALFYSTLLFILIACDPSKEVVNVPWYISERDADFSNYSAVDTLKKYDKISLNKVQNKANFLVFLSDLNYLNGKSQKGNQLIEAAFEADSVTLCNKYAVPLSRYLFRDSPYRKTSVPGVFSGNFDQYVSTYTKCMDNEELKRPEAPDQTFLKEHLWVRYLRILDQWYRIPNKREFDLDKQLKNDKYCQDKLDEIFQNKEYPSIKDIRSTLRTLILHSENCEWSHRWLKKYIAAFKDDKFLSKHLDHFLYRSSCREEQQTIDLIQKTQSEL